MTDVDSQLPRAAEDIHELLALVTLDGLEVYELRGRGIDRSDVDAFEENFQIRAAVNLEPEQLKTRFMTTFFAEVGEYYVDLAARYVLSEPRSIPSALAIEFAEKVGIMAAYPFVREHVFNLASRLGHPIPVLGMILQGQMRLEPDVDAPPSD